MKSFVFDFLRRGAVSVGIGPIVLAIVYMCLEWGGVAHTLSVTEVCVGIFSLSALAFAAGGLNALYQVERLPLMWAILIHGGVLYISYLCAYLLNDWLDSGALPLIIFTAVFVVGYVIIWLVIYFFIRRSAARVNEMLKNRGQKR